MAKGFTFTPLRLLQCGSRSYIDCHLHHRIPKSRKAKKERKSVGGRESRSRKEKTKRKSGATSEGFGQKIEGEKIGRETALLGCFRFPFISSISH